MNEDKSEFYKSIYNKAQSFLLCKIEREYSNWLDDSTKILSYFDAKKLLKHQIQPNAASEIDSLEGIYLRLAESLQNRHALPNVIGAQLSLVENGITTNGIKALKNVLCNFNPKKVANYYSEENTIFEAINNKNLTVDNQLYRNGEPKRSWVNYSNHLLSAAKFLANFESGNAFNEFVKTYHENDEICEILPIVIASKIDGIGYALACDFLKELGYRKYGKPDVHIKKIMLSIGVFGDELKKVDPNVLPDELCHKYLVQVANINEITPFKIDKLLWLIGSGRFYYKTGDVDTLIKRNNGRTQGGWRDEFIKEFNKQSDNNLK